MWPSSKNKDKKYNSVCCSRGYDLQQPTSKQVRKLNKNLQQNQRLIANGSDCIPKIKSNKPNQSLNWNWLPTQFQSRLERDTKKYSMPNWKWSINKKNINIKSNWIGLLSSQYKTQNQSGLDLCHPKTTSNKPKIQCQNCLTIQFQSHLERDTKQFPCQVGHCESRRENINIQWSQKDRYYP